MDDLNNYDLKQRNRKILESPKEYVIDIYTDECLE